MKRIMIAVVMAASVAGAMAQDSQFFQASLVPDIAIHSRETPISGISLNLWGEGPQSGFTLGFVNGNKGESGGVTLGLVNYAETYKGVQWGTVNLSSKMFTGVQAGLVNVGKDVHGLQLGFFNYTETLHGIQVGTICIVKENPWFTDFPSKLAKGFVFVNWSF